MKETRKGMLLIISGPSGVGKGTLLDRLLKEFPDFGFSVSATTRGMRSNEIPDVSYHFLTNEEFDALLAQDAFLEHANVHGNRYGTLKSEVDSRLAAGQSVILDIDVQGALNVMKKANDSVSIFILPPSYAALRSRLEGRATDSAASIETRLGNAKGEILQADQYDYAIVNDDLDEAYKMLRTIIIAEKQKTTRYIPVVE